MTTRPALAIAAGIILAVFFTAGLLAPVLAPYDLEAMDLTARLQFKTGTSCCNCH